MTTIIPARILRAHAVARDPSLEDLTPAERRQRDRILEHAPSLFMRYGRTGLSLKKFASALHMSPATVRMQFCDLDALLAHILAAHLKAIANALGQIPENPPDRRAGARAAYLAATRGPHGELSEMHALFIKERQNLPPDLRQDITDLHYSLGVMCAGGDMAGKVLVMLDGANFQPGEIETAMAMPTAAPKSCPHNVPDAGCFLAGKDQDDPARIKAGTEEVSEPWGDLVGLRPPNGATLH